MKDKILYLIIGILIGAIITTSAFLVYNKTLATNLKMQEMRQINGNKQRQPSSNENMGKPPTKPDGEEPQGMSKQNGAISSEMPSSLNKNNL